MEIISLSMYQYPCSVVLCMCVEYLGKKASFFRILLCSVSSIPVDGTMWYGEHFSWQAFSQLAPTYVRTHTHTDTKCRYSYNVHTYICAHTCAYMHVCACTHSHTPLHVRMYTCTYVYMPNIPAGTTSACSPVSSTLNVSYASNSEVRETQPPFRDYRRK